MKKENGFVVPLLLIAALLMGGAYWYFRAQTQGTSTLPSKETTSDNRENNLPTVPYPTQAADINTIAAQAQVPSVVNGYTQAQLEALAGTDLSSGEVPLGDGRYVTSGPKKGYVYLCTAHKDNPGSMTNGPWIHGTTWNFLKKATVDGKISWPNASFSNSISGASRILQGNGLPINHMTGTFPVASNDDAYAYDRNPNTIKTQTLKDTLALSPHYSDTPYCMGGEAGVMLSGVPLFNAFDAGLRDAPAHELQDSCDGHPQGSGEYHYHSLSSCFADSTVSTVLGYALDGFPITGPYVTDTTYLTTDDLDECHGITSEVVMDGKKVMTYHYVMTKDFPYSVSCFRGKPSRTGPSSGSPQQSLQSNTAPQQSSQMMQPPQEAVNACTGKATGASCSFDTPRGDSISGSCQNTPGGSVACVPR